MSDAVRVLVAQARTPADARAITVRLTDLGRDDYQRIMAVPPDLSAAVAVVEEADKAAMLRGAVAMMKVLQDRRAIPVSPMCVTCQYFRPRAHPRSDRPHHCAFVDAPFGDAELRVDCRSPGRRSRRGRPALTRADGCSL